MRIKPITVIKGYTTSDGTEFDNKLEAQQYNRELTRIARVKEIMEVFWEKHDMVDSITQVSAFIVENKDKLKRAMR